MIMEETFTWRVGIWCDPPCRVARRETITVVI
ncbi:hypothetical protein F4553_006661 [Allocatelliglobosispora scoriae]|uniref:Uncharacterized protein n=1 Tax=Allocatelliglobosispora scoriae TaxID=643052 RepID=A0A841BVV2_9ACTN|nr:hypothetical protein [Allocatelliglobosispora scoriae]